MPESEMSLPACLRDGLSRRELAVLTMARAGGAALVQRELDGIPDRAAAEREVRAAKDKAARILVTVHEEEGWPHTDGVARRAVPQFVEADHAEVDSAHGPVLGPLRGKGEASLEEERAIARAKRERRNGAGAKPRVSVEEFQRFHNGNGERDVAAAALDAAGVTAEQAGTIHSGAGGGGSAVADPPPPPPDPDDGFEYERRDPPAPPARTDEEAEAVERKSPAELHREAWHRREAIVAWLRENGPATAVQIREHFGIPRHRWIIDAKALRNFEPVGLIEKTGDAVRGAAGRASDVWRALSEAELIEREAALADSPEVSTDPSVEGVESAVDAEPEPPTVEPSIPPDAGGPQPENPSALPESPAPAESPTPPRPAPEDSPPEQPSDVVERARDTEESWRVVVEAPGVPAPRPPVESDAERRLREAERIASQLDAELPDTLLRARYLAALLRRIESGDTSADLLDRFERLAGFGE